MARNKCEVEINELKKMVVVGHLPRSIAIERAFDLLVYWRNYAPDAIEEILDCKREVERIFNYAR